MRKFVWIYICFFVFLSFSYMEETDISGLSRDEVNNIIGTWEENRKLVGRIGVDLFSWGIGAYIPNQSIIIDYVDETKKLIYVFQGGTTFYISAIKPLGLNKYQVDVYSPKELWGNHPEVRASLFWRFRKSCGKTENMIDFSHE